MARRLFILTVSIAVIASFSPAAVATGPGGWDHLGHGSSTSTPALNGHVDALNTDNPGVLYVGGTFTNAGGHGHADHLAQWDGSTWSAVNGSVTLNGAVDAIAYHAGRVYVGGQFTNVAGNSNIDFLAVWDGSTWQSPCSGTNPITAQVAALQIIGNTLYVGGSFQDGGGIPAADFLVACDLTTGTASATVSSTTEAFNSGVAALTADSNGTLYAGGGFINLEAVTGMDHVAYYTGGTWHQMGAGHAVDDHVRSLTAHGTNVYVGTDAVNIAGIAKADHIAKWDAQGLTFSALGSDSAGTNGWFNSFAFLNGMDTSGSLLFVAGSFQNANGQATADDFAYFDGTHWHPLGSDGAGNGPFSSQVNALAVYSHRVVAGGAFTSAGGDSSAIGIASHLLLRPDARIGTAAAGPFTGNNTYSSSGSGESKTISVPQGHHDTLYADIQNDGVTADTLKVTGPSGTHGFSLDYYNGATNVSAQVHAGTFSTGSLAPGEHLTLKVVIHVASNSANSGTFLISARSSPGVPVDAVRAIVHAT